MTVRHIAVMTNLCVGDTFNYKNDTLTILNILPSYSINNDVIPIYFVCRQSIGTQSKIVVVSELEYFTETVIEQITNSQNQVQQNPEEYVEIGDVVQLGDGPLMTVNSVDVESKMVECLYFVQDHLFRATVHADTLIKIR